MLPFYLKFKYFWTLKKRRFFYVFLIYMAYKYNERFTNWVKMRRAKAINKYKRRWLTRYNPQAIVYATAIEASYTPKGRLTEVN